MALLRLLAVAAVPLLLASKVVHLLESLRLHQRGVVAPRVQPICLRVLMELSIDLPRGHRPLASALVSTALAAALGAPLVAVALASVPNVPLGQRLLLEQALQRADEGALPPWVEEEVEGREAHQLVWPPSRRRRRVCLLLLV